MILEREQTYKVLEKDMEDKIAIYTYLKVDNSKSIIIEVRDGKEKPYTKFMRKLIKFVPINAIINIIQMKRKLKFNIRCFHRKKNAYKTLRNTYTNKIRIYIDQNLYYL